MSTHGGEWWDGEPLSFESNLKLILAESKAGIWLKWSKWLLFSPYCYHSGSQEFVVSASPIQMMTRTAWPT